MVGIPDLLYLCILRNVLAEIFNMTHADLYLENDEIFARWNYKVSSVRSVSIFPDKSDLYHYEIYKDSFSVKDISPFEHPTEINIIEADAIDAAVELKTHGYNPAIHNFANGYFPCGLYAEGGNGMEEDLCRRTTLSLSLLNASSHYPLEMNYGGVYSTAGVFRSSEKEGYKLLETPFVLHFISVPALNLRSSTHHSRIVQNLEYALHGEDALTEKGKEIMLNRMRTILRIAIINGHDSIVLGAWGCGNYKQRPKQIASMFSTILNEIEFRRKFRAVTYAISGHKNYVQFVRGYEGNARFRYDDRPAYFCYRIGEARMWGAEYPGDSIESLAKEKINHAIKFGITHFIDLTQEGELHPYQHLLPKDGSVHYLRFPIRDAHAPESIEEVHGLTKYIETVLGDPNNAIYLHCWGGVGRTATIAACWYTFHHGTSYYTTICQLLEMWKDCLKSNQQTIPDHWKQKDFIKRFIHYIRNRKPAEID